MPKKMEDRTPLSGYWAAIRSKNSDLADYKPDINGPIKTYDAGLAQYLKLMQDRDKLGAMLVTFYKYSNDAGTKIAQLNGELTKIIQKDGALINKSNNDLKAAAANANADPSKVTSLLIDLCTSSDDLVTTRKQIMDQVTTMGEAKVAATKKLRDDYKGKADEISSGMKKSEDDTIKMEAQIRSIIAAYQKTAIQAKDTDLAKAVRTLLDRF